MPHSPVRIVAGPGEAGLLFAGKDGSPEQEGWGPQGQRAGDEGDGGEAQGGQDKAGAGEQPGVTMVTLPHTRRGHFSSGRKIAVLLLAEGLDVRCPAGPVQTVLGPGLDSTSPGLLHYKQQQQDRQEAQTRRHLRKEGQERHIRSCSTPPIGCLLPH